MRALLLTGIIAATAGVTPHPPCCGAAPQSWAVPLPPPGVEWQPPRAPADTTRVTLALQGMTCGTCATTARLVLQRVDGVYRAEVSYDSASAVVWYDSTRTAPETFIAKLRDMTGYVARVVEVSNQREKGGGTD